PIGHRVSSVEVSIGIALSDDILVTAADLLRAADIASYRAKSLGGATTVMFDHPMASESLARIDLEVDLHNALDQREIEPWYQPEIDLQTGEVRGIEVLMRWNRPGHGVVLPATFQAIAEETGLIVALGQHIMEQTFRQVSAWERDGVLPVHMPISLNLSGRELRAADFVETMERLLGTTQVDPHRFRLEVTDSVSAVATQTRTEVVQHLLGLGMQFTIDCYGVGSGLIEQLRCVSADKVKVDRSFIGVSGGTEVDAVILKTVVDVASSIGVEVTVVGLDTEQQVTWAREAGCRSGQGSAFADAMPASAIPAYLSARQ
ncbi:MAG: EAL domain-containing protein, partial [Chloroflexota bacterium]|nr:EAL domain-containing protein [Chloroflexota bacterium]